MSQKPLNRRHIIGRITSAESGTYFKGTDAEVSPQKRFTSRAEAGLTAEDRAMLLPAVPTRLGPVSPKRYGLA